MECCSRLGQPIRIALSFFESAIGVCRKHLGPLVAVIARRISCSRKDVAEAVGHAIVGGRKCHGDIPTDLFDQLLQVAARKLGDQGCKRQIQANAVKAGRDLNLADLRFRWVVRVNLTHVGIYDR